MPWKQSLGKKGEELALKYFQERGYRLIKKNFRSRAGEIDLILEKEGVIFFVEVKTRSSLAKGKPYESVYGIKLKHLYRAVDFFLFEYQEYRDFEQRMLVASILYNKNNDEYDLEIYEI